MSAVSQLAALVGAVAGIEALSPDPRARYCAKVINSALGALLHELLEHETADELMEAAVELLNAELKVDGLDSAIQVRTMRSLQREATQLSDELLDKMRKGGL